MNILVTGGASGLGAVIVQRLAKDVANNIYFTFATSQDAAKEIETAYTNSTAIHCDFNEAASLDRLLEQIPAWDLDILINNANGNIHKEHFYNTDPGIFLQIFERDIMPTLRITKEAIKTFRKKKFGKIINIVSSAVVNKPPIGWSAYVANKSYLLAMSKSWATECIKFNVTSNSISPSFMLTNLNSDTDERIVEQLIAEHPLKKLLTTAEVADAVAFFVASSQQMNGVNLVMNAGGDLL